MKKQRRKFFLIIVGFLVALAVGFLIVALVVSLARPVSPADKVRPWAEDRWEEMTSDRGGIPAAPAFPAADLFDAYQVRTIKEGIQVELSNPGHWLRRPRLEHFDGRISPSSLTGAPGKLTAIGVRSLALDGADVDFSENLWEGVRWGPVHFFEPGGASLGGQAWTWDKKFRRVVCQLEYPRLYFRLDHPAHPELQIDEIHLFDRRTRVELSRSGTSGPPIEFGDSSVAWADYLSWRRNGALLALDVSFGPETTADLAPQDFLAEATAGIHTFRVMAMERSFRGGSTLRESDSSKKITATYQRDRAPARKILPVKTAFLVAAYPFGPWSSLEFQAFDAAGEEIVTSSMVHYELPYLVTCDAKPGDIATIRVTAPSRFARILIPLPDIPTLPPENDHLTDLFEMRIPYARTKEEHRLSQMISQLAQLRREVHAIEFPGSNPPARELRDITLAEAIDDLRTFYPPNTPITVDQNEGILRIGRPSTATWWTRFRDWWKGMLP